ncbi:MAG: NTP transferase domain-containing protein [Prosthecochloris sp.]|nr:NTP transferase domain-containing protein [Prosthecochloris sp.]
MSLAVIIMAAGKGTRMKSDLPKVLHQACGKPLVDYVIETSLMLDPQNIVLIVGHESGKVQQATSRFPVTCALQEPQLGTGHAVMQAEQALEDFEGDILILSGDAPLITHRTLEKLIDVHRHDKAHATVLTAELQDPTGYGRVIRGGNNGEVEKIVEQKDATDAEKLVREINSGVYVFDAGTLFTALEKIDNNNAQQEYYLTDVFGICFSENMKVRAYTVPDADEIRGINTPEQLQEAESVLGRRQREKLRRED